jgi:hypothetical protein
MAGPTIFEDGPAIQGREALEKLNYGWAAHF